MSLITSSTKLFCTAMLLAAVGRTEVELKAGVARVDITPSTMMTMYGYANRKCGPANGTHDPLYAKALVLEAGGSRIAIVSLDLGSMISKTLATQVSSKLNIPSLLLAASHTHSAPSFIGPAAGPAGATYLVELERKIFEVVERASQSMTPARLAVGRGSMQLGYNRLLLRDDQRARALFDNLERVPYGPVDPEFTLLRIDDLSGTPRALLVNYAVHPVVLGSTSCKYSADYPGVMQSKVEQELKGTQVMFLQGGAGDINPLFMGRSGDEAQDFRVMEKMGELLAAEVLRANRTMTTLPPVTSAFGVRNSTLTFQNRWEKSKSAEMRISTVLLHPSVAIAATPGEPMHRLQRLWKQQADVPYAFFYAYTDSGGGTWPGYIPDIRSAAYGGYGADAGTDIEVGAGERILLEHLKNLYELRGMWRDQPGRP